MALIDFLPELRKDFTTKVVKCASLTDDLERSIQEFLERAVDASISGPLQTVVRELIQNAIKANIKRLIFQRHAIDPLKPGDYGRGMERFHRALSDYDRHYFASEFLREGIMLEVLFSHHSRVSVLHISNPGFLYDPEERRIRQKFRDSERVDGLYQFYLRYSDLAEGSGMGIALAHILLRQLGLDPRLMVIFCEKPLDLTVSRLILPRSSDYKAPRLRFTEIQRERGIEPLALRHEMKGLPFVD